MVCTVLQYCRGVRQIIHDEEDEAFRRGSRGGERERTPRVLRTKPLFSPEATWRKKKEGGKEEEEGAGKSNSSYFFLLLQRYYYVGEGGVIEAAEARPPPSVSPSPLNPQTKGGEEEGAVDWSSKGMGKRERERERGTPSCLGEGPSLPRRLPIASPPPFKGRLEKERERERGGRGENSLSSDTIPNSPHVKYSPAARAHILIFRPPHARKHGDQTQIFFLSPYVSFLRWWPPRYRKKAQQRYSPFSLWRRL